MIKESFYLGEPVCYKGDIFIYPPTVRQAQSADFPIYTKLLVTSQQDLEDDKFERIQQKKRNGEAISQEEIEAPVFTPLEYLLASAYGDERIEQYAKDAIKFFTKADCVFLYDKKTIVLGDIEKTITNPDFKIEDIVMLTEDNYLEFQNLIRLSLGYSPVQTEEDYSKMDPRKVKMLMKARYRDRIKAKNQAKKGLSMDFYTSLIVVCCMGIGITPLNIGDMSYCSINAIVSQYQAHESYDIGIKQLIAGADSKKVDLKYWMRNLSN